MKLKGIGAIDVAPAEHPPETAPAPVPAAEPLHLRAYHPTDVRPLVEATRADGAEIVAPTHVLEKDGRIVGYGSAGPVRLIAGWTAPSVDDHVSAAALQLMERAAAAMGAKIVVVACTPDCRFKPFLNKEGYKAGKEVTLFFKKVG